MRTLLYLSITSFFILGCQPKIQPLPILGNVVEVDGEIVHHKIPAFSFVNQDSQIVDNSVLQEHIYIADFFFTSCPTICPRVMKQMLKIYEVYKDNPDVKFVSHSIDPKRDTQEHLKQYANNLGINHDKWYFLTGDKDALLDMADDYFVVAFEDPDAPGGFDHSGKIILVDKNGHVRGFCEGTEPESVDAFIPIVAQLLKEYEK